MERTFRTNIFAMFYLTKAALKHMGEGSAIVNTTSVTAYRGSSHLIDYAATKGAILAFTRSLSGSLVDRGIRVNAVAPGPIWTPLIPASFPADEVAKFGSDVPMGRAGEPEEVAPAYVFLASDDGSYFTGQVLHPNGGEIVGA
jgi:NAD(P)-dependent dehydrogenase (short-subunit alcohol dehydrogenase family)